MKVLTIFTCLYFATLIAMSQTKPAISRFTAMVDTDIINAFAPPPDSASTHEEIKQYFKDKATSMKTGYDTYTAYLTDYCYKYLNEQLHSDFDIQFGDKVPKDGAFSYTPYDYPQMGLKKAAKSAFANQYVHVEIKFGYKESFMNENSSANQMTPVVDINITHADHAGKPIRQGKGKAIATTTFEATTKEIPLWKESTTGKVFRADLPIRDTLLKELFVQAYDEFKKDFK